MVDLVEGGGRVTLITVHECNPVHQEELATVLLAAAKTIYEQQSGFISATIHKSLDGSAVTNYAQYDSLEAFESMRADPRIGHFLKQVNQLVTGASPRLYVILGIVEKTAPSTPNYFR